jgi:hypothetical protein
MGTPWRISRASGRVTDGFLPIILEILPTLLAQADDTIE